MFKKQLLLSGILILMFMHLSAQVKMWEESKNIPTYKIGPAEVNPVFSWSTSHQSAYPYPQKEILTDNKVDKSYKACWLENEYVKLLVLPEIGGRLHGARDKTNDYNFFYWQNTIKPALISMTGAWISGGIEWNFPHGHRPSCFSPVPYRLEKNEDGSKTIWVGENEWCYGMRWIAGLTLHPDKSFIEADIKFYNPTPLKESFQMWTTTAVHANKHYQMIYPVDIVTGHGKHEYYYWPVHNGVDLSWWKNVRNAASFFAAERSKFFGGYDHKKDAGTIFTANQYTVPGKKVWTWGSSPFGRIWEDILSEGQGPYFEPQMGAFSDNQPDFHWMQPGEFRSVKKYFYPVKGIGAYKKANLQGAVNMSFQGDTVTIGAYSTSELTPGSIVLTEGNKRVYHKKPKITPASPFFRKIHVKGASERKEEFNLSMADKDGQELVSYSPEVKESKPTLPEPAEVYGNPDEIESIDKLWHAGEYAYRFKEPREGIGYFEEVLRREPDHSRAHLSMGEINIKLANYRKALDHLSQAEDKLNDNGMFYYLKAIAEEHLGRYSSAYEHYYKSAHYDDYFSSGYRQLAELDMRRGDYEKAYEHMEKSIARNSSNSFLWCLKATVLRKMGKYDDAMESAEQALKLDPLSEWALNEQILLKELQGKERKSFIGELKQVLTDNPQFHIELSSRYAEAGLYKDAARVLKRYNNEHTKETALSGYYLGYYYSRMDRPEKAKLWFGRGRSQNVDYAFPFRKKAYEVFEEALKYDPQDGKAYYYMGLVSASLGEMHSSLIDSAIVQFRKAVDLEPENPRAWRNLGLCLMETGKDLTEARKSYETAFELAPDDSRILMELDQVKDKQGVALEKRLAFLKNHMELVESRDQLLKRMLMDLMNKTGDYEEALHYYKTHHFNNWEARYAIHKGYMEACIGLAQEADSPEKALKYYEMACEYPENLDVAPREPNLRGFLYYPMAKLHEKLGNNDEANQLLKITAGESTPKPTLATYFRSLALDDLGNRKKADKLLVEFRTEAQALIDGKTEGYEDQGEDYRKALGYYYMSKYYEAGNADEKAGEFLEKARYLEPSIAQEAINYAQMFYAGTHQ